MEKENDNAKKIGKIKMGKTLGLSLVTINGKPAHVIAFNIIAKGADKTIVRIDFDIDDFDIITMK